jgi:hypothetical protein
MGWLVTRRASAFGGGEMNRWSAYVIVLLLPLLGTACDRLPAMPSLPGLPQNPFAATPTIVEVPPTAPPSPTPFSTATPVPFTAYWVKNHRVTDMWSGPAGQAGVVSFGQTSRQFCAFQVTRPQEGGRLYVLNPYSRDYFWIDADSVGPVAEAPTRATGPKPADQNCTDQLYDP